MIARGALAVVGTAGIVSVAAFAPGLLLLCKPLTSRPRYEQRQTTNQILRRLQKRGCVTVFSTSNGNDYVRLTEKGREELLQYQLHKKDLVKKKWDNRWRLILFDVREKNRPLRTRLRKCLLSLGCIRLQDSVWIYPYPCEDVAELLRSLLKLRSEVIYLTTDRFHEDKRLCQQFNLKV